MATFLPNVTDVFAGPSQYTPDFNRIERQLKLRQSMYDQGAKQVKTLYDSIFNSALTRDGNIQRRDSYLKTISESMNRLSATDLSLPQNVNTATELFTPITTDRDFIKDYSFTKSYQTESQKAEALRTSNNDDERKKFSDGSLRALQYKAEEFRNASNDEALRMENPRYVPNVDIYGMAEKMFEDGKLSVKKDVIKGGYIWSLKNGDIAVPVTQSMMSTMFSQDPAIKDYLSTQAYVRRKDYIRNNAGRFNGDEKKAEEEYMQNIIAETVVNNQMQVYNDDAEVTKLMTEVDSWQSLEEQGKILKGSDDEKKYNEALEKLDLAKTTLLQNKANLSAQELNDLKDVNAMRRAVDGAVTMDAYSGLVNKLAVHFAKKDSDMSVKVDPLYLADVRADNSMELAQLRFQNSVLLAEIRANNQAALEDQKQGNRERSQNQRHDDRIEEIDRSKKNKTTKSTKAEATKASDLFNKQNPYTTADSTGSTTTPTVEVEKKSKKRVSVTGGTSVKTTN